MIPTEAVEAAGVVGWAEDFAQQIVESLDGADGDDRYFHTFAASKKMATRVPIICHFFIWIVL